MFPLGVVFFTCLLDLTTSDLQVGYHCAYLGTAYPIALRLGVPTPILDTEWPKWNVLGGYRHQYLVWSTFAPATGTRQGFWNMSPFTSSDRRN